MSVTPTKAMAPAVTKALATGPRPPRPSALSASVTFGWRSMLKIKHVPEQLLDVLVTPVLFLVMFTYLFGGEIKGSTGEYLQYVLPGILVQSVLFTTVYSGVALNTDMTKGVIDRFRSLPVWRPAPLFGTTLGDAVRYLVAGTVTVVIGLIMGFDPEGGVLGLLAALVVVVVFAFGLAWIFTTIGLLMRAPNATLNAGFMGLFPLLFLSNIFVEPSTLPGWLEAFVNVNPISHLVTVERELMAGDAVSGDKLAIVLGTVALLTAVFAPLTSHLYRRRA
jgi:ABC-2 type transport system permease protein